MSLLRADQFLADLEGQVGWYVDHAGWEVADRYLAAVQGTSRLLELHPQLGPKAGFNHPRLRDWRFYLAQRPFHRHVLFYELLTTDVILRRIMHGRRDLPRRLLDPS